MNKPQRRASLSLKRTTVTPSSLICRPDLHSRAAAAAAAAANDDDDDDDDDDDET